MPSSKKQELKVVLDANVWISALLWGGKPAKIIKAAEELKFVVLFSEEIIGEISKVLSYPRIAEVYQATGLRHEDLIEAVLKVGKFVQVKQKVDVVVDHPADDKFIECALEAGAHYIISGDKHLLKLSSYNKTKIISVNEFIQIIEAK
jgi:putative PIN family toxin of toxin-antitoxin system